MGFTKALHGIRVRIRRGAGLQAAGFLCRAPGGDQRQIVPQHGEKGRQYAQLSLDRSWASWKDTSAAMTSSASPEGPDVHAISPPPLPILRRKPPKVPVDGREALWYNSRDTAAIPL